MKAFANRARDWEDIKGILIRQGNKLQVKIAYERLLPLLELKEELENLDKLKALVSQCVGV